MANYIWVIGAGQLQLPVIVECQRRDFQVLATDGNLQAVGVSIVDNFVQLDTYDIVGHVKLAHDLQEKGTWPTAVLTDAADVGPTVSAIAEVFHLPACSYQTALTVRDKVSLHIRLGHAHPVWLAMQDMTPAVVWLAWERQARAYDIAPYPCVVKALDNCASRGMTLVRSYEDWLTAVPKAQAANKSGDSQILVEGFLSGPEFATDWLVWHGKAHFANGAHRIFDRFGVELGHTNPWTPPKEVMQQAQFAIDRLGVEQGPFKLDLLYDARHGWCILEAATRWSGAYDHTHTASLATGRNLVKLLVDYALGLAPDLAELQPKIARGAAAYAPVFVPGTITGWAGIEACQKACGVAGVYIRSQTEIPDLEHCATRPVFIITEAATSDEAWQRAVNAGQLLKPQYWSGP